MGRFGGCLMSARFATATVLLVAAVFTGSQLGCAVVSRQAARYSQLAHAALVVESSQSAAVTAAEGESK